MCYVYLQEHFHGLTFYFLRQISYLSTFLNRGSVKRPGLPWETRPNLVWNPRNNEHLHHGWLILLGFANPNWRFEKLLLVESFKHKAKQTFLNFYGTCSWGKKLELECVQPRYSSQIVYRYFVKGKSVSLFLWQYLGFRFDSGNVWTYVMLLLTFS